MKVYVITYSVVYETCDTFVGVFTTAVDAINFLKTNPESVTGEEMYIYEVEMNSGEYGCEDVYAALYREEYSDWWIEHEDSKEHLGQIVFDHESGETVWSK